MDSGRGFVGLSRCSMRFAWTRSPDGRLYLLIVLEVSSSIVTRRVASVRARARRWCSASTRRTASVITSRWRTTSVCWQIWNRPNVLRVSAWRLIARHPEHLIISRTHFLATNHLLCYISIEILYNGRTGITDRQLLLPPISWNINVPVGPFTWKCDLEPPWRQSNVLALLPATLPRTWHYQGRSE